MTLNTDLWWLWLVQVWLCAIGTFGWFHLWRQGLCGIAATAAFAYAPATTSPATFAVRARLAAEPAHANWDRKAGAVAFTRVTDPRSLRPRHPLIMSWSAIAAGVVATVLLIAVAFVVVAAHDWMTR